MLRQLRSTPTSVRTTLFLLFLVSVSRSKGFVVLSSPTTTASSSSSSSRSNIPNTLLQHQHQQRPAFFYRRPSRKNAQAIDEEQQTETKPADDSQTDSNDDDHCQQKNQIVISSQLKLPFSREVAFDAFSDLSRQPSWSPWLRSVSYVTPTETIWKMKRFLGLSYSWSAKTVEQRRPSVIAWESIQGLKNYGRVEFCQSPSSSSSSSSSSSNNEESLIRLRLTLVVPRVLTRLMGENSRVKRFIQTRMVGKSLRMFRDKIMEEQGMAVSGSKGKDESDETGTNQLNKKERRIDLEQ